MEQELKTFSLTLDMVRAMRSHPFEVVAGDTGNVLEVRLENDGVPVPLAGRYVCMVFRSGIGTALQDTDSGITLGEEAGTFSIALLPDSYSPGNVSADVQVYSGSDRKTLITSTRFTFRCRNALLNAETMRAQAAYPPLVAATRDAEAAAAQARAAAMAAVAATVEIGTVTTAAPGADAAVVNTGTVNAAVLDFTIPRGATGAKGDKGDRGDKGEKGDKGETGSYENHAHGNISNGGAIGSASGLAVFTGESGVLGARAIAQSDVSGLATALAGKAAASHTHTQSDVSGLSNALAGKLSTDQKGAANGVATLDGNGRVTAEQASAFPMSIFAGRTLSLSDAGKFLYANTSSAITITVPADATVNFPDGTEIEICRWYTGAVSIAAASGVYLCSVNDKRSIANRWGVVCLKKIASNAWLLAGDLG